MIIDPFLSPRSLVFKEFQHKLDFTGPLAREKAPLYSEAVNPLVCSLSLRPIQPGNSSTTQNPKAIAHGMKTHILVSAALFASISFAVTSSSAASATLTFVGDLPGLTNEDQITAISGDGTAFTGQRVVFVDGYQFQAFLWTPTGGFHALGSLDGANGDSNAAGISRDGTVIIGDSAAPNSLREAFRWTIAEGMTSLGGLPGGEGGGYAYGISADGTTVVGGASSLGSLPTQGAEPFVWNASDGMVGLGDLPGGDFHGYAEAVSADGSVVVGWSEQAPGSLEPFLWTAEDGMVGLGILSGYFEARARFVSDDGNVVIGGAFFGPQFSEAFRWTAETGAQPIKPATANYNLGPRAISPDGGTIYCNAFNETDSWPMVWDAVNGLRNLNDVLAADYNFTPPTGYRFDSLDAVSADGLVIALTYVNLITEEREPAIIRIVSEPPQITLSPVQQSVANEDEFMLSVEAEGDNLHFQWQIDGVDYPGATESTFRAPSAQHFHNGSYTVVVSNSGGSVSSTAVDVTVAPAATSDSRLLNLSTRALSQTGDNVLIPGFVLSGSGTKRLMIRAVGPTLAEFGVDDALEDPELTLSKWDTATNAYVQAEYNDDWQDAAHAALNDSTAAQVGAFPLSEGSADSSIIIDLGPGQYSAVAGGKDDGVGVAIVELYDADTGTSTCTLQNISNRGYVGTGGSVMIPGFSISEDGPKTLLIRAVGPALEDFGVTGVLTDPQITVFRRNPDSGLDEAILHCDNWDTMPGAGTTATAAAAVGAFPLAAGSADAAFVVTLEPGVYTVHAAGVDATVGTALVEVYVVP